MAENGTEKGFYWALVAGAAICTLAVVAFLLPVIQNAPGIDLIALLLIAVGVAETAAGWARRERRTGRAARLAGVVAILVGIVFLALPWMDVVTASYLIMLWLFIRGALLLYASVPWQDPEHAWLAVTGLADVGLGLVLLLGLPVTGLTLSLFGPTPEIIANFSLIVAASFVVAGLSLIVMSLHERSTLNNSTNSFA